MLPFPVTARGFSGFSGYLRLLAVRSTEEKRTRFLENAVRFDGQLSSGQDQMVLMKRLGAASGLII